METPRLSVLVTGHRGMVGSALVQALEASGRYAVTGISSRECDLRNQHSLRSHLAGESFDIVIHAAAVVGGIEANRSHPTSFLEDNLRMQLNVFDFFRTSGSQRLVFVGSSCMYPRECRQPMLESDIGSGRLEPTNESYALAKLVGLQQVRALRQESGVDAFVVVPPNLYGPNDCFDPDRGHVLASLVRRYCEAVRHDRDTVVNWGDGSARREMMHVRDLADACSFLLRSPRKEDVLNVGSGSEYSIRELATIVASATGFRGRTRWDASKPNGMPRKLMDSSRVWEMGWRPSVAIEDGVRELVDLYLTR